ncbi:MAG: hemerythrin domain-containing protein, partial [Burkholderiales bacterium]
YKHVLAVVLYELERFNAELEPHMATTERELYPLIDRLDAGKDNDEVRAQFQQLRVTLEAEHVEAGLTLQILRSATNRYEVPAQACGTLRSLYQGLKELEQLMQLHVHLENNVLFPRAARCCRWFDHHERTFGGDGGAGGAKPPGEL